MPISGWDPIYPVMKIVDALDPKTVLDVGVGTGQWGFLVRNYRDFRYGRFQRPQWKTDLIGIEVCSRYHNPAWQLYSQVRVVEAAKEIDSFIQNGRGSAGNQFDLSLMIEVLEHFEKKKGKEVLRNLAKISKNLIFSYANMEQGAAHGNEFEIHRAEWSDAEVREIFPDATQIYETCVGKFYHVKLA